jgi:hypothetical protein
LFSFLLILYTAIANAVPTQEFDFSSENIDYSVVGALPEVTDVDDIINISGRIISETLTAMGIESVNECPNWLPDWRSLTIAYLTMPRLNQLRASGYFGESLISLLSMEAITVLDIAKYHGTVIFIANSSEVYRQTDSILSHEIAHYWWTMLCLDDVVQGMTNEEFAVVVEHKRASQIALEEMGN